MDLLIVRHAVAADKGKFAKSGRPDDARPVTTHGRKKMKRNAEGLSEIVDKLAVIATSPLKRAAQTTAILKNAFPRARVQAREELSPGGSRDVFLNWLRRQPANRTVAAVGHEPDLSRLLGWLLTGHAASFVELRKGGACLLRFSGRPAAGSAKLLWAMKPSQLRDSR